MFAQPVLSTATEPVLPTQPARPDSHGTERNALEFHASQVLHTQAHATAAKPQSTHAQLEPIGMVTDVFMSLTSVLQAWFGKTTVARATQLSVQAIHMNSTEPVSLFLQDAHQAYHGTPPTVALQLQTPAPPVHTTTELSVFLTCHATTEKSGTTPCPNAFAHKEASPTEFHVFDAPLVNFTPTEVATAQTDSSSMEPPVLSRLLINVSPFQTRTGTELTASASQDSALPETHATAMVSSWVTTAKDAPQSQTQSGRAESANATPDLPMSTVFVL